ncbi:MAG: hypothetical protein ACOCQD_02655 [archaeon]
MSLRQILYNVNFITIMVVLQMVLMPLPNIQLTVLMMFVYVANNKISHFITFLLSYILIMGLVWGFSIFLIPMFIAWAWVLPLFYIFKTRNDVVLGLKGILFASVFGLTYGLFSWFVYGFGFAGFIAYMLADIPFQLIMMANNFATLTILFNPLSNLSEMLRTNNQTIK